MKILFSTTFLILLISCSAPNTSSNSEEKNLVENRIIEAEFQTILDSAKVNGSILIYDPEEDNYYSNDFKWADNGQLPASTFKIPNSIIALETEIVEDDSSIFYWNGEKRGNKNWEQNLIFKDALQYSCVPCYQEIARSIGVAKMKKYLDLFNYGSIKVDSSNIDMFWLEGESRINQFEQIDFLINFHQSSLSISKRTESIMKRMMIIDESDNYVVSGKTGWSYSNEKDNGWFVGYIESNQKTFFFATNIEPTVQFDINLFAKTRTEVTYEALKQMKIIK